VDISLLKRENELCRERIEGESPLHFIWRILWRKEVLIVEYKRVLFHMDEDLEKVISIVKEYQSRYGELEGVM
jgi:hypothetical protein